MGLLRPGVLPGLIKYSKIIGVLAKIVDSGWLAGKALMEEGKAWGNRG